MRTLHSDSAQTSLDLSRLQSTHDDTQRQLSLTQAQERSARAAARTAEAAARGLRDELARLKASVQQIRASCANDVRKRDVQLQRLKTHLTSQQRGNRGTPLGATITIAAGVLGAGCNVGREEEMVPVVDDPEYSLKQETTEFLTRLSQTLSDENDNLIGLVRSTLATLKELQGLPENALRAGIAANSIPEEQESPSEGKMLQALPISYDALATDMDHVLDNLRNLLTNPNFVPIEEVAIREEEISKLRSGWDKMEVRWKEAIIMMNGWRKRMLNGGDTVNIEEIKRGLGLGRDLNIKDTTVMFSASMGPGDNSSDLEDDETINSDTQDFDDSELDDNLITTRTGPTLQNRMPRPLSEGHGNTRSPRKVVFSTDNMQTAETDENAEAIRHRSRSPKKADTSKPSSGPQPNRKVRPTISISVLVTNDC
jgi:hypothetical protein